MEEKKTIITIMKLNQAKIRGWNVPVYYILYKQYKKTTVKIPNTHLITLNLHTAVMGI